MHAIKVVSLLFAAVTFSGCISTEKKAELQYFRDQRSIAPFRVMPVADGVAVNIDRSYEFKADTSVLDKDIPFTLQKGLYVHACTNNEGDFYLGAYGSVTGGGVFGMGKVVGGFFIPNDPKRRVMLWKASQGASITVESAEVALLIEWGPNPSMVLWVIAVPPDYSEELRANVAKEANKRLQRNASTGSVSNFKSPARRG